MAGSLFTSRPPCSALEAVRQFPTFQSNLVLTDVPLTITLSGSVETSSVTDDSFFVTRIHGDESIPGTISFDSTFAADDTLVFTPDAAWEWGARYEVHITADVVGTEGDAFTGSLPEGGIFVANIPNDFAVPVWNPENPFSLFTVTSAMLGFNPIDPECEAAPWEIPGVNVTDAWKYSRGRSDVVVAVIDVGIAGYHLGDVRRAFFLNKGELPLPNVNGETCAEYDCNGDGRFDVDDYEGDDRVGRAGPVNAADLIAAFSDGVDDDGNDLADDISGWDFLRGVNEPIGIIEDPMGVHGEWQVEITVNEANNGMGDRPGLCPECMALPIRASATVLYDYNRLAAAVRYAVSMGASVISLAGVGLTWSEEAHDAFLEAAEAGTIVVAASGDEMSFHHWKPSCGEEVLNVKTIFSLAPVEVVGALDLSAIGFTESFCTNYGSHTHLTISSQSYCTSEGTAAAGGILGLLISYARDRGIDLAADEAKQILTMTAYDIQSHCASVVNLFGVCQEGFDEHFGYGRPDMGKAMQALGDPDFGLEPAIPPVVRIVEPRWWEIIDPVATPLLEVTGEIRSRLYPCHWRLEVAPGHEPLEDEFNLVTAGTAYDAVEGLVATVPMERFFPEERASGIPADLHTFEATVRVRAWYESATRGAVFGEARKTISVHIDDDPATGLIPGFPIRIGASGESAPILYDLDGGADGRLEIMFGTGAGTVEALRYDEADGVWESMPGFPIDLGGDDPWVRDSIFASLAVGDLFGDGTPEIVAATTNGRIWVIDPDGAASGDSVVDGFPVSADPPGHAGPLEFFHGNGFLASPILADLDGDGMLEIVAASLDQQVYAWKPKGASGPAARLQGWPVLCRSLQGVVPDDKVCCDASLPGPIFGTPVVGVLDRSSTDPHISAYPSVVVATNEVCHGPQSPRTRVYAIFHDGMDHAGGPFLPGWPAEPSAPFSQYIPLGVIQGSTSSPAALSTAEGADIVVGTTAWFPQVLHYGGDVVVSEDIPFLIQVTGVGAQSLSSLRGDGDVQAVVPTIGALRFDESGFELFNSKILAFDLGEPHTMVLEGEVEALPFLTSCSTADLDNDGLREVLGGTGGYLVHAFSLAGGEAPGWPKFTHKWITAAPAVGDMDADGELEIVAHTREGALYAWESEGEACPSGEPNSDWRRFHHDERNTGFYGTDTLPPAAITDLVVRRLDDESVKVRFTAPGDDWGCGRAASYDIRITDDHTIDLTDHNRFVEARSVEEAPLPGPAGVRESFIISAPAAAQVAVCSLDESGNRSRIGVGAVIDGDRGGRCGCSSFGRDEGPAQVEIALTTVVFVLFFLMMRRRLRSKP